VLRLFASPSNIAASSACSAASSHRRWDADRPRRGRQTLRRTRCEHSSSRGRAPSAVASCPSSAGRRAGRDYVALPRRHRRPGTGELAPL
jgi:hypothetical protein